MVGSHPLQSPKSREKESLPNSEILGFEDLSFSIADSFLDFEYISDWIEGNPEPCQSMASDLRENPVGFNSQKVELGMSDGSPEKGSSGFGGETEIEEGIAGEGGGKLESLGQEKVQFVGIEKVSEMGELSLCEKIKAEEGVSGSGDVNLGGLGCLVEEEMEKASADGGLNELVSAFGGMGGINQKGDDGGDRNVEKLGGKDIGGGCDVVKSADLASVNGSCIESGLVMIPNDSGEKGGKQRGDEDKGDSGTKSGGESESKRKSSSSATSEGNGDSESERESESSSSSSSSGDDDEEGGAEMEEGEIVASDPEEMVAWSGEEHDEDDGTGVVSMGPLRSKNELTALPPVPPVNVRLQPHHQILPIGTLSSVIGVQVIVEGVEKHNPLNEGSILWITKSGTPLGIVDEIFGPVKNPYYIVRYNSENEIPDGVQPGTTISFVPEFANHVLNDKSLYQRGYDASGANDEELLEEDEFSDDEKEAEYKKMLKNKKRGTIDENSGNKKKAEKRLGNRPRKWQNDSTAKGQVPVEGTVPHAEPSRLHMPLHDVPPSQGNQSHPSGFGQGLGCHPGLSPPLTQLPLSIGFGASFGGPSGIPFQQPPNLGVPQMQVKGMPWAQQMHPQQLFQMPPVNGFSFQPQRVANPNLPSKLVLPGGQPGFGAAPAFAHGLLHVWGQNTYMGPPFGMATPVQQASLPMNVVQQAAPSNISEMMGNYDPRKEIISSSTPGSPGSFSNGRHYGGGRKPNRRGGGRFRGGRGRQHPG